MSTGRGSQRLLTASDLIEDYLLGKTYATQQFVKPRILLNYFVIRCSVFAPGGMVIGPDGALYVTNNNIFSGQGQVRRIKP